MEIVFLIGVIQGVFLSALVLMKKNKMLADKILAAWLLFMGLHLFAHYLSEIGIAEDYPVFLGFAASFPMLQGAFTFLYVSVITSKVQRLKWQHLIHVSHYVFFTVLLMFIVFTDETLSPIEAIANLEKDYQPLMAVFLAFVVFLGPVYMVLCLNLLRKHKRRIASNFSYTEEIDLKWLKYVVSIMIAIWAIVVVANILSDYSNVIDDRLGGNIIFTALTIAIFLYGIFGIRQQVIFSAPAVQKLPEPEEAPVADSAAPTVRYEKSGLKKHESEKHLEQLLKYMEDEDPYLNGKLSLKDVATELEISTNHLSQIINESLGKNFFDFVNSYRVELVKEKMSDSANKNYTLLALAFECGFNSKSSFNLIFKKFTGTTPTQFLNSIG